MKNLLLICLTVITLTGCKTYNEENKQDFDKTISQYIKKHGGNYVRSETGLYYQIIAPGHGKSILATDEVSFTYKGKLLNGMEFDASHKNTPITFKVNKLIMAWQEAMYYVKNGGEIKIICPPQLGYGEHDLDKIPPNSILCFELNVKDVK